MRPFPPTQHLLGEKGRKALFPQTSYPFSAFTMVLPSAAGLSATWMPALRIASIL